MKKKLFLVFLVLVFVSCSKEDAGISNEITYSKTGDDLSKMGTSLEHLETINLDLQNLIPLGNIDFTTVTEQEARAALLPLIQNGNAIHLELLNQLQNSFEWQELSEQEKFEISNFSEQQLAILSLFYYSIEDQRDNVAHCFAFAVGALGFYDLIKSAGKLGTAATAIRALKIIVRRYAGYVGTYFMVYDFISCINAEPKPTYDVNDPNATENLRNKFHSLLNLKEAFAITNLPFTNSASIIPPPEYIEAKEKVALWSQMILDAVNFGGLQNQISIDGAQLKTIVNDYINQNSTIISEADLNQLYEFIDIVYHENFSIYRDNARFLFEGYYNEGFLEFNGEVVQGSELVKPDEILYGIKIIDYTDEGLIGS